MFNITSSEMEKFLAIIIYSGYVKLPEEQMYWSTVEDLSGISFVSSLMSRDCFLQIKQCLHVADSFNLGTSKTIKNPATIRHTEQ